jgi:urease accessory protein
MSPAAQSPKSQSSARLRLVARADGSPMVEDMFSSGALAFRPTEWGIWMVGAAAHPVGGDRQWVRLTVGPGCAAEVRSVAATLARPGPRPGEGPDASQSVTSTAIRVAPGGALLWKPEPGIAAAGADHFTDTRVRLAAGARLVWWDEWTLGRHREEPGTWRSRSRIIMGNRLLLASDLATGPGAAAWPARSVLAAARAVSSVVVVGDSWSRHPGCSLRLDHRSASGVSLPLAGPGAQFVAWGQVFSDCHLVVRRLLEAAGLPAHPSAPSAPPDGATARAPRPTRPIRPSETQP